MNFDQVRQDLRGKELATLNALGIVVPAKQNQGSVCPNCGGIDRFSWFFKEKWLYNCRHCGGGDCFDLLTKIHADNPKEAAKAICGNITPLDGELIYEQSQSIERQEKEHKSQHDFVASKALSIWETVHSRTDHPYLENRGLYDIEVKTLSSKLPVGGISFDVGSIVVPLYYADRLMNLQLINDEGDKRYLKGGQKKGCNELLPADNPTEIYICEGYATAITVWLALDKKQLVAVAFDAGNIPCVADSLRSLNLPLVFMADNDKTGIEKAREAAKEGESVCIPSFNQDEHGTDWDDYRQLGYNVAKAISVQINLPKITGENKPLRDGFVNFPDLKNNAKPIGTFANLAALVEHLGYIPAQNAMNLELEMLKNGKPVDSSFERKRSYLISECLKAGLPKSIIDDHLTALCERNKYHPVKSYLDSEKWDGIHRLESLLKAMNPKDITIAKAALDKWFVACVAALYEDHFSCKIVPILQGGQSFKKTAFISRFANVVLDSFLEGAELNPDNKDSLLSCIKSWIVELGELERTSKNSQGSLKAFITKANDSVRPPYARSDIKKKRQTTLIATVNGTEFLRDETGSSRYVVIELEKAIDMDSVNSLLGWSYQDGRTTLVDSNKLKQFWLEIKVMYESGASWELTESELQIIADVNKQHNFKGNWYEFLADRFVGVDMGGRHFKWMTSSEVCAYCDITNNKVRIVGKALKAMAEDGLIEKKPGRANKMFYNIPVISEK